MTQDGSLESISIGSNANQNVLIRVTIGDVKHVGEVSPALARQIAESLRKTASSLDRSRRRQTKWEKVERRRRMR